MVFVEMEEESDGTHESEEVPKSDDDEHSDDESSVRCEEYESSERTHSDNEHSDNCKDRTYHWHIGLICAIVVFVLFTLLHTRQMCEFTKQCIPNTNGRTLCVGLVLASLVYLTIGLLHVRLEPIVDHSHQNPKFRGLEYFV